MRTGTMKYLPNFLRDIFKDLWVAVMIFFSLHSRFMDDLSVMDWAMCWLEDMNSFLLIF